MSPKIHWAFDLSGKQIVGDTSGYMYYLGEIVKVDSGFTN